ncbi:hypothetical protein FNI11_21950 [Salmonella enterica subsp. salamae]|nr:hypothetical protein [Salmonella enterica subsp. salamae]ECJ2283470.1 hypothetical protein [Salmonella enterica subsp. salamae]
MFAAFPSNPPGYTYLRTDLSTKCAFISSINSLCLRSFRCPTWRTNLKRKIRERCANVFVTMSPQNKDTP